MEDNYSIQEAADELGVDYMRVYRAVIAGKIRVLRDPLSGRYAIDPYEVKLWKQRYRPRSVA